MDFRIGGQIAALRAVQDSLGGDLSDFHSVGGNWDDFHFEMVSNSADLDLKKKNPNYSLFTNEIHVKLTT